MIFKTVRGRAVLGAVIATLIFSWVGARGMPLAQPVALASVLTVSPGAQCASATEGEAWRGRYGGSHVAVEHQYYCGPAHSYSPEWYEAHVGPHPEWYAVYETEPTTCATY